MHEYMKDYAAAVQDYEMWFALIRKHKFIYLNKITSSIRLHPNQDSNTKDYVVEENEHFWKYILSQMTDDLIIKTFGNKYNMYLELYHSLKYSNYEPLKNYLQNILYDEYIDNMVDEIIMSRNFNCKVLPSLEHDASITRKFKKTIFGRIIIRIKRFLKK